MSFTTCPALRPTYTDEIYAKVHDCPIKESNERLWQFVMAADDVWNFVLEHKTPSPTIMHKYEIMRQRIMKG